MAKSKVIDVKWPLSVQIDFKMAIDLAIFDRDDFWPIFV